MKPCFALLLLAATTLCAQVPSLINYQGSVAVGSVNFNGAGQFKFALVDGVGTTLWRNHGTGAGEPANAVSIAVTNGLYSVLLGDATLTNMAAIPAGVFNVSDVRLRVWFNDGVNGSQLLTPDQRIAAVGYAIMAGNVPDAAITSAKIASGAVGPTQLAAGAVGSVHLGAGAVGVAHIAVGAVGAAQLANNSVGPTQLADGSITAGKIAVGAVSGEVWTATAAGAPSGRVSHTAIWTGSEMIIWGGTDGTNLNDGARYNPALNTWTAITTSGSPAGRANHTAVWTGSEMIVWGGIGAGNLGDGGRYNPVTNSWIPINSSGAPSARRFHTAVWTGSEMIVWGGRITGAMGSGTNFNDGARYNPTSNTWAATNPSGTPAARWLHSAVWTGLEMIVWGGSGVTALNDGSRYNPVANSWSIVNSSGAPSARVEHSAVWTGTRMIVWGGNSAPALNDGGSYDPTSNTWTGIANSAVARFSHTTVWTGSEMVVWGGSSGAGLLNTGERYNAATNTWMTLGTSGAPTARSFHTAIWSGSEMIVWGGLFSNHLNDGGRLRLANILPASISPAQLAVPLQFNSAVPSGSIVSGTNTAVNGAGVAGISTGGSAGIGVIGDGGTGTGVKGVASGGSSAGVWGISANGGKGVVGESTSGFGVYGITTTGTGVYGFSNGSGLAGQFFGAVDVFGRVQGLRGAHTAILGGTTAAIEGLAVGGSNGVFGQGGSPNGVGVSGNAGINGIGIYGSSNTYAGWFAGDVNIIGNLFKGGGAFRIDHPLDPANKYLSHSFVESPDMMNIYNGNITLDARGEGVVELPKWFDALNKEFRYQLTCLGGFAPVYIAEEIDGNRFTIGGGKAGLKVSWQVTGIRQDSWANAHRIPVEEEKSDAERGSYLHPAVIGQSDEKSVEWARHPELMRRKSGQSAAELRAPEQKN